MAIVHQLVFSLNLIGGADVQAASLLILNNILSCKCTLILLHVCSKLVTACFDNTAFLADNYKQKSPSQNSPFYSSVHHHSNNNNNITIKLFYISWLNVTPKLYNLYHNEDITLLFFVNFYNLKNPKNHTGIRSEFDNDNIIVTSSVNVKCANTKYILYLRNSIQSASDVAIKIFIYVNE